MKHKNLRIVFISLISSIVMYGCFTYDLDKLSTEVEFDMKWAVPVAKGSLSMRDLLPPDSDTASFEDADDGEYANKINYYTEGSDISDTLIRILYVQDSALMIDELVSLPKLEPYEVKFGIGTDFIGDIATDDSVTFIDLSEETFSGVDSSSLKDNVIGSSNLGRDYISGLDKSKSGNFTVEIVDGVGISYVTLESGVMTLKVDNQFEVPISFDINLLTIQSQGGTFQPFKTINIPRIEENSNYDYSETLNNETISGTVRYEITNVHYYEEAGNTPDPIDSDDNLILGFEVVDLKIASGLATFYDKMLSVDTLRYFSVTEENGNRKLYTIDVDTGNVDFEIISGLNSGLTVSLSLPSTTSTSDGGFDTAKVVFNLSENKNYPTEKTEKKSFDLAGYTMDLTTNPDQPYNSLPAQLNVALNSQGTPIKFSSTDSVTIKISNIDSLYFSYITGNWGLDTVVIEEEVHDFDLGDFFPAWKKGQIIFTDPKIKLNYVNPMGIDGLLEFKMTGLKYDNNVLKEEIEMFDVQTATSQQDSGRFPIISAVNRYTPTNGTMIIDKNHSEIVPLMAMLPNKIRYSGTLYTNYGKDTNNLVNFMVGNATTYASLEAELPLKLRIVDFVLQEQFEFGFGEDEKSEINDLGKLRIFVSGQNDFPLNVALTIYLLDTTLEGRNQYLDSLNFTILKAPVVAGEDGRVPVGGGKKYVEEVVIDRNSDDQTKVGLLDNFLLANKLEVAAKLQTSGINDSEASLGQKSVTFLTRYKISFNMAIDANFKYKTRLD